MAAGSGSGTKRKRAGADIVPYSREVAKKGRKELEEKREVFLGGLVIEEVELVEGDGGGESFCLIFLVFVGMGYLDLELT